MKKLVPILALAFAVGIGAMATPVRFNTRDISGKTNDLPLQVEAVALPFLTSNAIVVGFPIKLQTLGGTVVTDLEPGSYKLTVLGPVPQQTLVFVVTNSEAILDVIHLRTQ